MRYMLHILEGDLLEGSRFKAREMDTLLHQDSKGKRDDDTMTLQTEKQKTAPGSRLCNFFQKDNCTFSRCRYFHQCAICDTSCHGAISCTKIESSRGEPYQKQKPPHKQYRRDRAGDG